MHNRAAGSDDAQRQPLAGLERKSTPAQENGALEADADRAFIGGPAGRGQSSLGGAGPQAWRQSPARGERNAHGWRRRACPQCTAMPGTHARLEGLHAGFVARPLLGPPLGTLLLRLAVRAATARHPAHAHAKRHKPSSTPSCTHTVCSLHQHLGELVHAVRLQRQCNRHRQEGKKTMQYSQPVLLKTEHKRKYARNHMLLHHDQTRQPRNNNLGGCS